MPRQDGLENARPAKQVRARLLIGVLAQPAPVRIAEDVDEEHFPVVLARLDDDDIRVGIDVPVALHPNFHAGVNERAEGLRQNRQKSAIRQALRIDAVLPADPPYRARCGLKAKSSFTPSLSATEALSVLCSAPST